MRASRCEPLRCGAGRPARDAARIAHCAGHAPLEWALAPEAVSPHRATLKPPFEPEAIRHWLADLTADTVLVEGVGGWRVPLHVQEAGATDAALERARGLVAEGLQALHTLPKNAHRDALERLAHHLVERIA